MIAKAQEHLEKDIIPFWKNLRDEEYGGYYGFVDFDGNVDKKAIKGCILNSRILWFFSNAYLILQDESLLSEAKHAYDFMQKYCIDREKGGIYWSMNYDGTVDDDIKHTYNQAFAIYALASYYDASKDSKALEEAYKLYELIEQKCTDEYGYLEAFNRDFTPASNEKLSENGVMAEKTMNTLLHVMEAYTELYRVDGNDEVGDKLRHTLDMVKEHIYNPDKQRQEVFFDSKYNSLIDLHSYGHDIESSWLLERACDILNDRQYGTRLRYIETALVSNVYEKAYKNHSFLNECQDGVDETHRIWWVQAEAVVGFINAYEMELSKREYLDAAKDIFDFIMTKMIRPDNHEWYWQLDENGVPDKDKPIVEPWKCPYHTGRMCMEIIKRGIE